MSKKLDKIYMRNDLMFKRVLGDDRTKDTILRSFLKAALKLTDEDLIKIELIENENEDEIEDDLSEITIGDPASKVDKARIKVTTNKKEKYQKEFDKLGIVDIKCTTKTGKIIIIELQVEEDITMRERVLYSNAKRLVDQLNMGDPYSNLKQVISIVISIDHVIINECKGYKYCFKMIDEEHNIKLNDLMKILFLEFKRITEDLKTTDKDLITWLKFIGSKDEEEMKMLASTNSAVAEAFDLYKKLNADQKFRMRATDVELAKRKQISRIADAEARGRAEMAIQKSVEIAKNAIQDGFTPIQISRITGLSIQQIEELR
ncbi:MAG: Rpn family recombination-promoting nuclease/putative transposase [Candidatus Improbicoccus pseudotrichonymphae]|uniref:Rpn family recombination-promoting nuclease/putative transposase n=1 Tax=Candidatus Improbicoccus pseudotrichonymphae TaxID=3033792 RepID=A0AA48I4P3_9FIRM|nr:MAG: Rpn family recombination-promoting nuclease/putative transposase [Candidatus Improbicoccus pseudotrichonymphae]